MPARVCSECANSLAGKPAQAKTCGDNCRARRSRRIKRANEHAEQLAAQGTGVAEIAAIVRTEAPDVINRVLRSELQPIVREALTEDVLRAINELVGLTPRAVAALTADLDSENETIRQRAYTLLIKYTVGHPALVKPDDTDGGKQLVVNFNLPRPDEPTEVIDADAVDATDVCDMCHDEKSTSEFVAGSQRCQACFDSWRETVKAQFA